MSVGDTIGWTATAVFTASYLTNGPAKLRRVQMVGASLWLTYGLVTQAPPVIGSNILVLTAACWAEYRHRRSVEVVPAAVPEPRRSAAQVEAA